MSSHSGYKMKKKKIVKLNSKKSTTNRGKALISIFDLWLCELCNILDSSLNSSLKDVCKQTGHRSAVVDTYYNPMLSVKSKNEKLAEYQKTLFGCAPEKIVQSVRNSKTKPKSNVDIQLENIFGSLCDSELPSVNQNELSVNQTFVNQNQNRNENLSSVNQTSVNQMSVNQMSVNQNQNKYLNLPKFAISFPDLLVPDIVNNNLVNSKLIRSLPRLPGCAEINLPSIPPPLIPVVSPSFVRDLGREFGNCNQPRVRMMNRNDYSSKLNQKSIRDTNGRDFEGDDITNTVNMTNSANSVWDDLIQNSNQKLTEKQWDLVLPKQKTEENSIWDDEIMDDNQKLTKAEWEKIAKKERIRVELGKKKTYGAASINGFDGEKKKKN